MRQHSGCFPARQHLGHAQGEVIEGHDVDAVKLSGGPRQSAQARGAVTSVQWRGKAPKHVGSSLPKSLGGLLATGASYSYSSQRGHAGPAQLAVSRVGAASAWLIIICAVVGKGMWFKKLAVCRAQPLPTPHIQTRC